MTSPRILIVEDEAVTAMDLADRLATLGYDVVGTAATGERAIDLVERHRPDLVLMDIRLRGEVDGIASAREIHDRWRTAIIFLTAHSDSSTVDRAKLAQPFGYVLKPYNDLDLRTSIEIALHKHAAEEEILRLNRLLDVLSQVNQAIVRVADRQELLRAVCRVLVERGQFELAWVGVPGPDASRLVAQAVASKDGHRLDECTVDLEPGPESEAGPVSVLRTGLPYYCNHCVRAACVPASIRGRCTTQVASCASLPIQFEGRIWGTLNLLRDEPEYFRDREIAILDEVAMDVTFALDKIAIEARREAAERELSELARFNAEVLDALASNVCVLDGAGTVLSVNRAWRQCWDEPGQDTGTSPAEAGFLAGCDAAAAAGMSAAAELAAGIRRVLQRQVDVFSCEHQYPWFTGRHWYTTKVTRFQQPGPTRVVVEQIDVTQRHEMETSLRRAKDKAEDASKAKDQLMSMVSHELRTPLSPILAISSYLEERADLPADLLENMRTIRLNVEQEARIVEDLLDFARMGRGKVVLHRETVDLHVLIREVIAQHRDRIDEKALELNLSFQARSHVGWVDPVRMRQVLSNLLDNAVKFTPAGGLIRVVSSVTPEGRLRVEIVDSGIGIAPDVISKLFSPFEQGELDIHREFGGLGLGLAIASGIMDLHGGSLTAASDGPGTGSTFALEVAGLEAASVQGSATQERKPSKAGNTRGSRRILLVEDNKDTLNALKRLLTSDGCEVLAAATVREAMATIGHENFDILVSDVLLPDGSGLDVMREVSCRTGKPGIAVSGFGLEEDLCRSREAGFSRHLVKPVRLRDLRDAIEEVIDDPQTA